MITIISLLSITIKSLGFMVFITSISVSADYAC